MQGNVIAEKANKNLIETAYRHMRKEKMRLFLRLQNVYQRRNVTPDHSLTLSVNISPTDIDVSALSRVLVTRRRGRPKNTRRRDLEKVRTNIGKSWK
jgi:3-hydroxymyristoyl/3-hydroxydecanoyl-(acyl carrier protein) dehydratase